MNYKENHKVYYTIDTTLSIDYSESITPLIKVVQELTQQNQIFEEQIIKLELNNKL